MDSTHCRLVAMNLAHAHATLSLKTLPDEQVLGRAKIYADFIDEFGASAWNRIRAIEQASKSGDAYKQTPEEIVARARVYLGFLEGG